MGMPADAPRTTIVRLAAAAGALLLAATSALILKEPSAPAIDFHGTPPAPAAQR